MASVFSAGVLVKRFISVLLMLSGLLVGGLPTAAYADCSTGPYIDGNPTGYQSYTAGCKNDGVTTINSFTSAAGTITADNATPTSGVLISGTQQGILNFGTINSLNNSQTISGGVVGGGFAGIASYTGTIGTLINNVTGTISAYTGVDVGRDSSIGLLINSGNISGSGDFGIYSTGVIGTVTNTGTISGAMSDINNQFISGFSNEHIGALNNLQGINGGASNALTYTGTLPINYNVIIDGPTNYGQLSVSGVSGTMAFGIDSTDSTGIAAGTYPDVLQGFNSLSSVTGTTGTFGTFSYSLVQGTSSDKWSLVVTANPASGSTPGGSVSASLNGGSIVGTPQFTTPTNPPAGVSSLPYGVFGFTANVPITNPPSSITVTLVYPQALAAGTPIFKDTTGNGSWVDWTSNVTFNQNRTSITYTITDNGLGDSNPAAGVISDPIGPGISAASVPSLSEWTQLLLALMVMTLISWQFHRERSY
jgi:hypothetical protein